MLFGFSASHPRVMIQRQITSDPKVSAIPWNWGKCGALEPRGNSKAMTMRTKLFRLNGTVERDPAIDGWMNEHTGELGAIAQKWFEVMRKCGDEVRDQTNHLGKLSFCSKATKRGSDRRSSRAGSAFRNTRPLDRSA